MDDESTKPNHDVQSLHVMDGVATPPSLNPAITSMRHVRKSRPDVATLTEGVLQGDRVLLSQAITLIESQRAGDRPVATELISSVLPKTGNSLRIGITGVPGVGKSTFIESFGLLLIERGHKVAVLAVDPSSERSGGSILGDKTRMELLSKEESAYIRPTPSGATLGGVARFTRQTILLVEAAGFDRILIETVGVGQSEVIVHSMVDLFMLLALPGAGDELQGMKRGIMEMADAIVVNKADGDNIRKAKMAAADLSRALNLFRRREDGWTVPVKLASALTQEGLPELAALLEGYFVQMQESGWIEKRRRNQSLYWMQQAVDEALKNDFERATKDQYDDMVSQVWQGQLGPFEAAEQLIASYHNKLRQ